jgi:tetratricopeptide (TPR) repeat protein
MKDEIIKYIKEKFYGIHDLPKTEVVECVEKQIDEYHKQHELDLELIIYESLILLTPPLADYEKSIELLKTIEAYETTILKAIIQFNNMGFIEIENISELKYFLNKQKDEESISIIYYLLALGNENLDQKIESLNKSIFHNPNNVLIYIQLSTLLIKKKEREQSNIYLKKGLSNIKKILNDDDKIDVADFDFFVRESIIGSIVSKQLFEYWEELLEC